MYLLVKEKCFSAKIYPRNALISEQKCKNEINAQFR